MLPSTHGLSFWVSRCGARFARHASSPQRCLSSSSSTPLEPHAGARPLLPLSHFISTVEPTSATVHKRPIWYVCGPTVYAPPHIGHARCYVTLDFYRRVQHRLYLLSSCSNGNHLSPLTIMNVTDIDDKIVARSAAEGISVSSLTRRHELEFTQALSSLNVWLPDLVLRVSEHMDVIVKHVESLVSSGAAYVLPGEGVYFDVGGITGRGITKYGKLGMGHLADVQGGGGGATTPEGRDERPLFEWTQQQQQQQQQQDDSGEAPTRQARRSPRDFALWKVDAQQQPSSFPSPWGFGRPGWHIECTALISHAERLLGQRSTVDGVLGAGLDGGRATVNHHGGGVDLKFPHHTNEIIQGEGYHLMAVNEEGGVSDGRIPPGGEWIGNWVHPGHLYIKGRKMSKSLKNFVTVQEMVDAARETIQEDERQKSTVVVKEGDSSSPSSSLLERALSGGAVTDRDAADLFRLWTLGYSGRPTGNANWSDDRLKEMQRLRRSVIKLLLDVKGGESGGGGGGGSRRWTADEVAIFKTGQNCRRKLDDMLSSADGRPLEPSAVIREIMTLVEVASQYIEKKQLQEGTISGRGDILETVGRTISEYLELCGFSEGMTKPWERFERVGAERRQGAGASAAAKSGVVADAPSASDLQLFEVLRQFRAQVRRLALSSLKESGSAAENAKRMLKLCDDVRGDEALKKLGIEIVDDKVAVASNDAAPAKSKTSGGPNEEKEAKQRVPANSTGSVDANKSRKLEPKKDTETDSAKKAGSSTLPLPKELFKKGKNYVGVYDTFDITGLPLTFADDGRKVTDAERSDLKKLKVAYIERYLSATVVKRT